MTRFGFTGTRRGISVAQQGWLSDLFTFRHSLHHGACVGADETAHHLALGLGNKVVVHPPADRSQMMVLIAHHPILVLPPRPYLRRNRDIVDACELLLACPDGEERLRSGTWATIRYAVKIGRSVLICYPDGRLETR